MLLDHFWKGVVLLKPSGWGVCDGESELQLLDLAKDARIETVLYSLTLYTSL
jgi:hypothetical protein